MQRNIVCTLIIMACCCQCGRLPATDDTAGNVVLPQRFRASTEPILPILVPKELSATVVALGAKLYHDKQLSGSQQLSCATCHPVDGPGMVTTEPHTPRSRRHTRNASYYDVPTIFNKGDAFAYFWNGRAQNLESVVRISIQAENIMDGTWGIIMERLATDPDYADVFALAFPQSGLTKENTIEALATYIRSLTTPNSAFDRWLNGENLPDDSIKEGYRLFTSYGCIRCHQGKEVGGNMYASFQSYIESKATRHTADYGRYNVTKNEAHRYQFKVPGLRNVAVTAPYFHDGSAATLSDAVDAMARYQLGRTLTRAEIAHIVSFLESLTGRRDNELLGKTL